MRSLCLFQMKAGKRVLIAAHGNSLRGIVKHLDEMSDEAIMGLNLPTGIPFVYELDENLKPVVSMKVHKRKSCESITSASQFCILFTETNR